MGAAHHNQASESVHCYGAEFLLSRKIIGKQEGKQWCFQMDSGRPCKRVFCNPAGRFSDLERKFWCLKADSSFKNIIL